MKTDKNNANKSAMIITREIVTIIHKTEREKDKKVYFRHAVQDTHPWGSEKSMSRGSERPA